MIVAKQNLPLARIALTPGEPAGIGPDICIQLAQKRHSVELVVLADPSLLKERAAQLGLPLQLRSWDPKAPACPQEPGCLCTLPIPLATTCSPGQLQAKNATYVLETLSRAAKLCLANDLNALVTGPIHKGIINDAGIRFSGHTEFLAMATGGHPVMMLSAPNLRVALATTHLPLAKVSAAITQPGLEQLIQILHQDLQTRFGLSQPRILVCGLNPHAGEGGYLGSEEIDTIIPVLQRLRKQGLDLQGPLPADTLFTPKYLTQADAVLAMYHDQGLPVLKYAGFGRSVNITLGLPIIRTSVDHGTAIDLAGTGQANSSSLEAALALAIEIASRSPQQAPNSLSTQP